MHDISDETADGLTKFNELLPVAIGLLEVIKNVSYFSTIIFTVPTHHKLCINVLKLNLVVKVTMKSKFKILIYNNMFIINYLSVHIIIFFKFI